MNAPTSSSGRLLKANTAIAEQPAQDAPREGAIRVMIVDDSLTVRTIFKRMVESDQSMDVVATASSAERAIAQLKSLDVHVVLLDLEMPGMGGLDALPALLKTGGEAQVLVVSSLTDVGAEHTMAALSMGAADTMLKPRPGGFTDDYRGQLLGKIRALGGQDGNESDDDCTSVKDTVAGFSSASSKRPEVIAIGASTGGIHALNLMLRSLPPTVDLPILITQHLPQSFISVFARQIEMASARRTHIACDGTEIRPGEIAIAPGHGHMMVRRIGERLVTRISAEPSRSGCMPSVDPMLTSLTKACNGQVLAVILSGMGRDGLEGAKKLSENGGTILAQDADSSAVWGMPGAVTKAGLSSLVAPPEKLSEAVISLAGAPRRK